MLLEALENNEEVTDVMLYSNDSREQFVAVTYCVFLLISGITYIQWFRSAYFNLSMRTRCIYGEGWASGSWFVPLMSLVRPYRIMIKLSTKTTDLIIQKNSEIIPINSNLVLGGHCGLS